MANLPPRIDVTQTAVRTPGDVARVIAAVDRVLLEQAGSPTLLFDAICAASQAGGWTHCAVAEADPYRNSVRFVAFYRFGPSDPFALTESLSLPALLSGRTIAIEDVRLVRRFPKLAAYAKRENVAGILVTPIPVAPPEMALWLATSKRHHFSINERRAAREIARHIGSSITRERRIAIAEEANEWIAAALRAILEASAGVAARQRAEAAMLAAARSTNATVVLVDDVGRPTFCIAASPAYTPDRSRQVINQIWSAQPDTVRRALRLASATTPYVPYVIRLDWWLPESPGFAELSLLPGEDRHALLTLMWDEDWPDQVILRAAPTLGVVLRSLAGDVQGLAIVN